MPTFLVIAHQHPNQLARLVSRLRPYPVIVHINIRVDQQPFEAAVSHLDNVSFLPTEQRASINWSGYSMVKAIQSLIRAALECTEPDDHVVVLTGGDYPIRPVEEFAHYLRDAPFRQHIRYFEVSKSDDHHRRLMSRRHYRDLPILRGARRGSWLAKVREATIRGASQVMRWHPPAPCPPGFVPMRGSTWVAITASCARDVLQLSTPAAERWFARIFCPDEMYLHTLVAATRHAAETPTGGPEPYRGREHRWFANFHILDDSLNKFFTIEDRDEIEASDMWFLRKVAPPASDTLVDWIDARIEQRTSVIRLPTE